MYLVQYSMCTRLLGTLINQTNSFCLTFKISRIKKFELSFIQLQTDKGKEAFSIQEVKHFGQRQFYSPPQSTFLMMIIMKFYYLGIWCFMQNFSKIVLGEK